MIYGSDNFLFRNPLVIRIAVFIAEMRSKMDCGLEAEPHNDGRDSRRPTTTHAHQQLFDVSTSYDRCSIVLEVTPEQCPAS